ncbi:L-rhamnose mutarotase [Sphingomonas sp. CFBP 13720]|uniref:L-rhamnose mutarotase n=1 Tax=Sphingomonas sp. CFBP 13720 TaxID=2775302 RepID=UPI00177DFAFC|nr:L-rhamnose mutarotase [Sphingomonas sp. CFBP 13720]MBD8678231.1 L-rhamnose mutarotase [Sphingomonas sp. CFBP 13720]
MIRVLTLDLVDDTAAIAEYERWHRPGNVPAAVLASIRSSGITQMEIFRTGARLAMVVTADATFDAAAKAAADAADPDVVAWEARMGAFQRALPHAPDGSRWTPMAAIFRLTDHA